MAITIANHQSTTRNRLPLPQQIARMDGARLRAYRENLTFYQGNHWPESARRRERRLTFNYARALIDKTTSYLMTGLNFAVDPVDDSEAARERARRAEAVLWETYEANNLAQLDFETELDAAVLGDACFKVTWDAAEERVRISSPDVQGIFVWWQGDDITRLWRLASRYQLSPDEAISSGLLTSRNSTVLTGYRRSAITITEVWTAQTFELWADTDRIDTRPNPYGFIPFVVYPNLREPKQFWGVSDIPAIKESVRELNRALSQLSMILELSGNPIAVLENVTDAQDIAVQPGAVWELPERARAYLLDLLQGGGVKLHVDYVNLIYRTLHDLGESPRSAFGDNPHQLSGVALEMELDPLLKKVQRKRLIRTAAYKRRNEMVLRLWEQFTGERLASYRTRVIWGSVLPQDRSRLVADARTLVTTGIHSRRRAADDLGVEDPEGEFTRWLEEERQLRGMAAS